MTNALHEMRWRAGLEPRTSTLLTEDTQKFQELLKKGYAELKKARGAYKKLDMWGRVLDLADGKPKGAATAKADYNRILKKDAAQLRHTATMINQAWPKDAGPRQRGPGVSTPRPATLGELRSLLDGHNDVVKDAVKDATIALGKMKRDPDAVKKYAPELFKAIRRVGAYTTTAYFWALQLERFAKEQDKKESWDSTRRALNSWEGLTERQKTDVTGHERADKKTRQGSFKIGTMFSKMAKETFGGELEQVLFKKQRDYINDIPREKLAEIFDVDNIADAQDVIAKHPKKAFQQWLRNVHKVAPKMSKVIRAVPENIPLWWYMFMLRIVGRMMADQIQKRYFASESDYPIPRKFKPKGEKKESLEPGDESIEENVVADTIIKQMGGMGKLRAMLGAKNFVLLGDEKGVSFMWPSKKRTRGNAVEITLDLGKDLYTMTFYNVSVRGSKKVKEYDDLQWDQLKPIFERQTGLYLSF